MFFGRKPKPAAPPPRPVSSALAAVYAQVAREDAPMTAREIALGTLAHVHEIAATVPPGSTINPQVRLRRFADWYTHAEIRDWLLMYLDEADINTGRLATLIEALRGLPGVRYRPHVRISVAPEYARVRERIIAAAESAGTSVPQRVTLYYLPSAVEMLSASQHPTRSLAIAGPEPAPLPVPPDGGRLPVDCVSDVGRTRRKSQPKGGSAASSAALAAPDLFGVAPRRAA